MSGSVLRSTVAALALVPFLSSAPLAARAPVQWERCTPHEADLWPADGEDGDRFGGSVALEGDTALVGAAFDDMPGQDRGAAYLFDGSAPGWPQQAKLSPADVTEGEHCGFAVSLSGETALIGVPDDFDQGPFSGSVYVFVREGSAWSQQAKLLAGDGEAYDRFGFSVALHGDTALVGAFLDDDQGFEAGSAYVFVRTGTTWTQEAKVLASDGASPDYFGASVALSGDTAVVGAYLDSDLGNASGSAYVFVRSGSSWSEQAKLVASDGAAGAHFGWSVSVDGDRALVGAYADAENGLDSGAAYVFARSGTLWTQEAKLLASDGIAGDEFGRAVALRGGRALVGAPYDDDLGTSSGSAWLFVRGAAGWSPELKLVPPESAPGALFGFELAMSGERALVGAKNHSEDGDQIGAAFVFELPTETGRTYCRCAAGPCGNPDAEAGCANSTGGGATLVARGTTSPDELDLIACGGAPGQPALLFQGDDAVMLPFGDGFRCAAGHVVRISVPPLVLGPDGTAGFGPGFGDPSVSSITGVAPGSGVTKRYQLWYRDPQGPCSSGFNLSTGYEITW